MAYSVFKGPIELPSPLLVEGVAGAAMFAGNIVAADFTIGAADTTGRLLIIREGGIGKGEGIDYAYESGDQVLAYNARQGLIFAVRAATGQALVSGVTLLERGADGRLVVLTTGTAIAIAKQTVTTTANDELVEVEIL